MWILTDDLADFGSTMRPSSSSRMLPVRRPSAVPCSRDRRVPGYRARRRRVEDEVVTVSSAIFPSSNLPIRDFRSLQVGQDADRAAHAFGNLRNGGWPD